MTKFSDQEKIKYEKIFTGFAAIILLTIIIYFDYEAFRIWNSTPKFLEKLNILIWFGISLYLIFGMFLRMLEYRVTDYLRLKHPDVWERLDKPVSTSLSVKRLNEFEKNKEYLILNDSELNKRILFKKRFYYIQNIIGAVFFGMVLIGFINELEGPHWRKSLFNFIIAFSAPIIGILVFSALRKK